MKKQVTLHHTHLFLHGGVAVVLKSSQLDTVAPAFRSSRLALKKNLGILKRYKIMNQGFMR